MQFCHPERSIAIGFINRNAQSRDLLFVSTWEDLAGERFTPPHIRSPEKQVPPLAS
jgi:hypothetical protein